MLGLPLRRSISTSEKRLLVLLTDAYGANGGIAKVNRDLLGALCTFPEVEEVVALPRLQAKPIAVLPERLDYQTEAAGGKGAYARVLGVRLLRDRRFDTVICGHLHLLPFAALAARVCGARLLLIIHGIEAWQPSPHRLANWLVGSVDQVVAVSDFSRLRFCAWSRFPVERVAVIPNSVDLERFTPGPRRADLIARYGLEGKRVILTLGRLAGEQRAKGFDPVLDVLPALLSKDPEIVYLIAGEGPDRARLEAKASVLGVADQAVFTGLVAEEEKADHYRLADVFAMPSRGEGFGIVLIEALACGVPVIASSADASREAVLEGQLGAVVDPDDPAALKAALLDALSSYAPTSPRLAHVGLATFDVAAFRARWHAVLKGDALPDSRGSASVGFTRQSMPTHA